MPDRLSRRARRWWRRAVALAAALVVMGVALAGPTAFAQSPPKAATDARLSARMPCEALLRSDFSQTPDAPSTLLSAKLVPASDGAPEYCDITGYVQPQIQFELRLPTHTWNGRYFQVGCGGFCGVINIQNCGDVLAKDFAVAADNMGHVGDVFNDPLWASSEDLRRDYGRRSTHVTAIIAKAIVDRFYGAHPAWSYFRGCSTGGREALMEAAWAPEDFDGLIGGDPAFAGRLGAIANTWDAQHLFRADGSPVFSPAALATLHKAVLAACDGLDGVVDGIIMDPRACHFRVDTLRCADGREGTGCLGADQVAAAEAVYDGPRNSRGERLYPGGSQFGSEASWGGLGSMSFPAGAERYLEFTPNPPSQYTYRDFDFDADPPRIKDALRRYDPVPPGEAPDLTAFERRGGKLIVYHGWADGGVSPINTLDYYSQVAHLQGGLETVRGWFRLFMVPGMFHCRGGDAPNTFDFMPAIMAWVEKGVAPDGVIATQRNAAGAIVRQRPLYAYPEYAAYAGAGDVSLASSWRAAAPPIAPDDRVTWIWGPPSGGDR